MNQPGERRYIDDEEHGWTVYIRDDQGIWSPIDQGGPGYLTDRQASAKEWRAP